MVYIFGDLRQLRKFELSRPRISAPKPLDASSTRPDISSPVPMYNSESMSTSSFLPLYAFRRSHSTPVPTKPSIPPLTIAIPERPPAAARSPRTRDSLANSITSTPYDSASQYSSSSSSYNIALVDGVEPEITVSPAYYDPDPAPEGPATRTGPDAHPFIADGFAVPSPLYRFGTATVHSEVCRFNRACYTSTTAGFIAYDDDNLYDRPPGKTAEEGRAGMFDFDSLPVRDGEDVPCICEAIPAAPSSVALPSYDEKRPEPILPSLPLPTPLASAIPYDETHNPRCTELQSPAAIIGRAQYRCNHNSALGVTPTVPANQKYKSRVNQPRAAPHTIENQHHRIRGVPAFGPLTRVLSPVVSRAQWEIVVRSAFVAMLLSLSIIGSLLAVPVRH